MMNRINRNVKVIPALPSAQEKDEEDGDQRVMPVPMPHINSSGVTSALQNPGQNPNKQHLFAPFMMPAYCARSAAG